MSEDEPTPADDAARVDPPSDAVPETDVPETDVPETDDEDWDRRVADWTAGRRTGSSAVSSASESVPASYEPDPAVYEPVDPAEDEPRRRRFAWKRPIRSEPVAGPDTSDSDGSAGAPDADPVPRHAEVRGRTTSDADAVEPVSTPLHGVATWTPDDEARTAAMMHERPEVDSAEVDSAEGEPAAGGPAAGGPADDVQPADVQPVDERTPDEQHAASVSDAGPRVTRSGRLGSLTARLRSREKDRRDQDDDEGPFFPPEPADDVVPATLAAVPVERPRPRPPASSLVRDAQQSGPVRGENPPPRRPRPGPGRRADPVTDVHRTTSAAENKTAPATENKTASTAENKTASTAENKTAPADGAESTAAEPKPARRPRRPWREALRASRGRKRVVRLVITIVVVVAAALALRTYVVAPYYIPSQSMEPTLHGCPGCNDDHVLVHKFSYRFHQPHAGDIVVFDKPAKLQDADSVLIKRVIGVGGDLLVIKNGLVYVNGRRVSEPYINKACGSRPTRPLTSRSRWQIPTDDVFVMGDNRCMSEDSRFFGPIPDSSIVGRAFAIVWPLKRLSLL